MEKKQHEKEQFQTRNYQRKVLLVEDSLVNQMLIERFLTKLGLEVVIAENGQKAVEIVQTSKFHLIFMDLEMPVLDGISATKEIREKKLSMSPIIALTAHDNLETRKRCNENKMNGYMIKPVTHNNLIEILDKFFSSY